MVPKAVVVVSLLFLAVAFLPAAEAQEQTKITDTRVEVTSNPFLSVGNRLARGESTQGFVETQFCHGAGGFSPQGAGLIMELTIDGAPSWLEIKVSSELSQRTQFPFGPYTGQTESCPPTNKLSWDLVATATRDAPYDEIGQLTATITVTEDGTQHTYKIPQGGSVKMSVQIEEDPGEDVLKDLERASNPTTAPTTPVAGTSNESNESPAPPIAFMVLGLIGLLAFVRRRSA